MSEEEMSIDADDAGKAKSDVAVEGAKTEDNVAETALEDMFKALGFDKENELFDKILRQYEVVRQQGILDGEVKHWLACCLYTTSWTSTPSGSKALLPFSTIVLLEHVELSIMEFIDKLEKWVVMLNAQPRLLTHIETVQANLSISVLVFKKFLDIFREILVPNSEFVFSVPDTEEQQQSVGTYDLFSYIWIAYLGFKKQLTKTREKEDLMNCFHLMLVVTDLIISDLIEKGGRTIINPEFLAKIELNDKSVLDYFCENYNGVSLDCKHFRVHWFQQQAHTFIEEGCLKMNAEKMTDFLENIYFNSESLNRVYEEVIVDKFEIDERIFFMRVTADMLFDKDIDFAVTVGLRPVPDGTLAKDAEMLMKKAADASVHKINVKRNMLTPMSGKSYLTNTDMCYPMGSSEEKDRVAQLSTLLVPDSKTTNEFLALVSKYPPFLSEALTEKVIALNDSLVNKIKEEQKLNPQFDKEFAAQIDETREQVSDLFRRFLHRLTLSDYKRAANPARTFESLCSVLQRDDFISSLYACAMEIYMFSHKSQREFPWSLQVLQLAPITFYKVIEPVIRCDSELTREMQKHLNRIEERVLEELAWTFDSPIWKTVNAENVFPSYDDVMLPEGISDPRPIPLLTPNPSANILTRFGTPNARHSLGAKRRLNSYEDECEPSPKKFISAGGNSLIIFARKVYYLAALHLNDLCDRLRMEEKNRKKVWTLFEHILKHDTALMRGRHLDQNLMCCLYIIARVSNLQIPFHEILYHYRHQPQASSRVYRHVLICTHLTSVDDSASRESTHSQSAATAMRSGSTMPAPGMTSAPPTPEPFNTEYNDLINFYNRVFVKAAEDFVRRLAFAEEPHEKVSLLPVPTVKCNTLSPRKVISSNISVIPMMGNAPQSPARPLRYNVNRSPSKDLHHINAIIRQAALPSFRLTPGSANT